MPPVLRLLATCIASARSAGAAIRTVVNSGIIGAVEKYEGDMQTAADRESQGLILSSLAKHYPTVGIVAEEETYTSNAVPVTDAQISEAESEIRALFDVSQVDIDIADITLWIDPLDNTAGFVDRKLDEVTVLIGMSVHGAPVGGIIHQPFCTTGSGMIWGLQGLGVHGLCSTSPTPDAVSKNTIVTAKTMYHPHLERAIQDQCADNVVNIAGAGIKFLHLLQGSAGSSICAVSRSKKWDTCAGDALLKILGGNVTNVCGEPIIYDPCSDPRNVKGVVASLPCIRPGINLQDDEVHHDIIRRIPNSVKDSEPYRFYLGRYYNTASKVPMNSSLF